MKLRALSIVVLVASISAGVEAATFNIPNGDVAALVSAMNTANSNNQDDTINLATNGLYTFTTVNNTTFGPCATPIVGYDGSNPNFHSLTINANGATITRSTAAGTPDFRLFTSQNIKVFTIDHAIITNGHLGNVEGAGVYINGTTTLNHCTIADNVCSAGGCGINNVADTVLLDSCSIVNNQTTAGHGGGIKSKGGDLTMVNCTVADNGFEGLANIGQSNVALAEVHNCTFIGNKIYNSPLGNVSGGFITQLHIGSTILSNATLEHYDPNHSSSSFLQSDGYNLATDNGGGFLTATGDKINTDPKFDPAGLITYGAVRAVELTYGSPAIDAGKNFAGSTYDQRGYARIINNTSVPNASDGADIGATEAKIDALQYGKPSFVVNTIDDHDDGICGGVDCTLREAIARSNSFSGIDHIDLTGQTGTITLGGAELVITDSIYIDGPGARLLTINANTQSRVLSILGGATSLYGLTLRGGFVSSSQPSTSNVGGGIYNETSLTMTECTLVHNSVLGSAALYNTSNDGGMARGGAIFNGGTLLLDRCTIGGADSNATNGAYGGQGGDHPSDGEILYNGGKGGAGLGGAVYNDVNATATITNCTIAGNAAAGGDGGAANHGGAGGDAAAGIFNAKNMTITASTISKNSGSGGAGGHGQFTFNNGAAGKGVGGVHSEGAGTAKVQNSILAANTHTQSGGIDVDGAFVSSGFNLIGTRSNATGFPAATDLTGSNTSLLNPLLGPIQNNGGATDTMALLDGSPAIESGNRSVLTIDQRGEPRPSDDPVLGNQTGGDGSDIGAYERAFARITAIARSGSSNVIVSFRGTTGKRFQLQRRFLMTDPWQADPFAPNTTTATSGVSQLTDIHADAATKIYYRIQEL